MTTILLNLHNAGFFKMNAMILGMGLCYGGLAQVIAGVLEPKNWMEERQSKTAGAMIKRRNS